MIPKLLSNKRALITGLVSNRSIAYGIAEALHAAGAELAFSYQDKGLESRIRKLTQQWDTSKLFVCDVSSDEAIKDLFVQLKQHWDTLDIIVHSIAFAPRALLEGDYLTTLTREGFIKAHDISSYSFAALAAEASPMLNSGASLVTLSYIGSTRVLPSYNVMGVAKASLESNMRYMAGSLGPRSIRVNAISAGPIKTLAASGVKGLKTMLHHYEKVTPLRRNVTTKEVGNTAAFLCSDMASGITGEVLHVDAGYHIMGMNPLSGDR